MDVEPAHINQFRAAQDGRMVEIDKDVGGVADELKRIDAGLKVRFAEDGDPPFFVVRHEYHDGCPHNGTGGPGSTYLVRTVQAYQNRSGVWEGLDQRIVNRIMRIGHSSYDYGAELERANLRALEAKRKRARERIAEPAEEMAFAVRRDLGLRKSGRVLVPRNIK